MATRYVVIPIDTNKTALSSFKPLIVVAFFMLQLFDQINKIYKENNSIESCYKCCILIKYY